MRPVILALVAAAIISMAASCRDDNKDTIPGSADPERTPTMITTDVSTVISDSGITRYKITTPLWLVFEEAQEPKWRFPEGVHLEKFDQAFRQEATIDCDSATFFKDMQLWRLDGYVNIRNTVGEKFLTNQLFWDQRRQKIYSDSFIHIERDSKIIEGYGFESNESMTHYNVLQVSGIFPASQFKRDSVRTAAAADTMTRNPAPRGAAPGNSAAPGQPSMPEPRLQTPRAVDSKALKVDPGRLKLNPPRKSEHNLSE